MGFDFFHVHRNKIYLMEQKKFLFISYDALISDIAWRVAREGNQVKYYIKNPGEQDIADGFVPKTDDWKREVEWADVVVFDDVLGHGIEAKKLREQGKCAVGGTPYTDQLEDDREFGQDELKKFGVTIIPNWNFSSFKEAIDFVRKNPARYVIKPSGKAQNIKRLLFVGEEEDGKDVLQVLEAYEKSWATKIKIFQLQRRVDGVEVAVGAFFNGSEFAYPINVNFEHKKLFPGNLGPSTGEMGTSMFWSEPNRIFDATLRKMEAKLKEEKYVGYIDINCIVNSQGIYPLEFTARFGYPTIHIQSEGINMPMGEFLMGLADGSLKQFKTKSGFQVGVVIAVPPFPFQDTKTFEANSREAAILFKKPNYEGVHIQEVKIMDKEWVIAGTTGEVLVVVGTGYTMR